MAISDKLNYLIETKSKFKDRLNSLGAEIIESTTFRNYLNWLDEFYGNVSDKTDLAKNGVVGRTSQNPTLPTDYTRVDYIESSGTQYIDTGFIPNQNTRTIIDFTPISSDSSSVFIFGSRIGFNNNAYGLYAFGPKFRDDYANTNYGNASSEPFPKSANKRYLFDKNKNHSSMYEDNVQFYDHAFTKQTINLSFNMFLFGANSNGSPSSSNLAKMKLYSCKIYDDDTPIRDFIPCYRNSNNVVGLYDLVNDVFYTNQGTGAFTYGSVVTEPSPEYPLEINNLSGDVEYKVRGKNLLPTNASYWETGHYDSSSGEKSWFDTRMRVKNLVPISPSTTYYVSNALNKRLIIREYNANKEFIYDTGPINSGNTFTTENNTYYLGISIEITYNEYDETTSQLFMCNNNVVDKTYEPYISESFPLSLKSRNLFDKDNANVLDGYINYVAKIISERNDKMIYIPCKPNTTYILQKMVQEPLSMNRFRVATSETEPTYDMTVNQFYNPGDGGNIEKYIITTNDKANYLIFYCYYALNNETTFEEILSSVQIEEGSTPTDYEPYYDIELCNISDYKDRIYSQNGEFYLEKKNGKVVLDGSENWLVWRYGTNSYGIKIANIKPSVNNVTNPTYLIANLFKGVSYDDRTTGNNIAYSETASSNVSLYIRNTNYTSITSFKAMLETTNLIVYYVLATPTTTEITQENYPTLYSQLLAIQEFLTKYKINNEFLLDYSSPEIEY